MGLNDPPKTSAFDYESGVATFQDPFIGVELGRVENPSWWQRAGAGTLGALQGFSPFKGAKGTARASTKATEKVSRLKQARPMGPAKNKRAQGPAPPGSGAHRHGTLGSTNHGTHRAQASQTEGSSRLCQMNSGPGSLRYSQAPSMACQRSRRPSNSAPWRSPPSMV